MCTGLHFLARFCLTLCVLLIAPPSVALASEKDTRPGQSLKPLGSFKECDVCPEMIVLPMGSFQMGSTPQEATAQLSQHVVANAESQAEGVRREGPRHPVRVDLPIAMARTEVTRAQWIACVADGGCDRRRKDLSGQDWLACLNQNECRLILDDKLRARLPKGIDQWHPNSPIRMISYDEAQAYLGWLNKKVGQRAYRLPTEAEWEYAARAGTQTPYAQGDVLSRAQANYKVYSRTFKDGTYHFTYDPANARAPLRVNELDAANAWGLRHMSGNVAELTRSCWSERQAGFSETSRYLASTYRPLGCQRVYKGGSYNSDVTFTRPAHRLRVNEDGNHDWLGFRVLRDMRRAVGPTQ